MVASIRQNYRIGNHQNKKQMATLFSIQTLGTSMCDLSYCYKKKLNSVYKDICIYLTYWWYIKRLWMYAQGFSQNVKLTYLL